MNNQEFDQLLRDKFSDNSLPQSKNWEDFRRLLHEDSTKTIPFYKKTIFKWSGVAAACLIIGISTIPFFHTENIDGLTVRLNKHLDYRNTSLPSFSEMDQNDEGNISIVDKTSKKKQNEDQNNYIQKSKLPIEKLESDSDNLAIHEYDSDRIMDDSKRIEKQQEAFSKLQQYTSITNTNENQIRPAQLGSIGVSSGLSTGRNQNGVNLALNGVYNINDNLFIEGTIAYQNNKPNDIIHATKISSNSNIGIQNGKAQAFASPAITNKLENLHYIQINPSVGYKLNKMLSVSFGADIQSLLNDPNQEILIYNKEVNAMDKVAKTDIGITSKTELQVTKNIKTGISFRNGINNLIKKNDGLNFVNRQYLQLHFRYNINFNNKQHTAEVK